MQIVNIVESIQGFVNRIFSFSEHRVTVAEEQFIKMIQERNGATLNEEDREYYLDEAHFEDQDFTIDLIWSTLDDE